MNILLNGPVLTKQQFDNKILMAFLIFMSFLILIGLFLVELNSALPQENSTSNDNFVPLQKSINV